jgi:hypothetical protein
MAGKGNLGAIFGNGRDRSVKRILRRFPTHSFSLFSLRVPYLELIKGRWSCEDDGGMW